MNADGTGQIRLTSDNGNDIEPTWSPDESHIAFASNRDGDTEIYVINADGSGTKKITDNNIHDYAPTWGSYVPP